jgi:hypothetical protein
MDAGINQLYAHFRALETLFFISLYPNFTSKVAFSLFNNGIEQHFTRIGRMGSIAFRLSRTVISLGGTEKESYSGVRQVRSES